MKIGQVDPFSASVQPKVPASENGPTSAAPRSSPMHWQFRALPQDVQRVTIRRLALTGLRDEEIALRTGMPQESVRRAIAEDDCLGALLPPAALHGLWPQGGSRHMDS